MDKIAPQTVSVVIPHYNSLGTLERALESVSTQTVSVFEILIIDDASTTVTFDAIVELSHKFPNTHVIANSTNAGPSIARNRGWDLATGDWIAFLDADDIWHPQKIQMQLSTLESNPDVKTIGGSYQVIKDSASFSALPLERDFKRVGTRKFLLHNPLATSTVMTDRSSSLRFPTNQRYAEDFSLWLDLAQAGPIATLLGPAAATFKEVFGDSGLSSHVFRMISWEYRTYWHAYKKGAIRPFELLAALALLTLRAGRRTLLVAFRKIRRAS